eukprot:3656258-Prorocentrum_lima.AAC.1
MGGNLSITMRVTLCNVPNLRLLRGVSLRRSGTRAPSGTYPTQVIKTNNAARGEASVYVPSNVTNK